MNLSKLSLLMVTLSCVGLAGSTSAQRLYDAKRDEQAQGALKIVTDLQSGTLFDKQLKNLSLLAKRDMEASLAAGRARMRTDINSFTTWTDVNCVVGQASRRIAQVDDSATITQNLANLTTEIGQAKNAFDALKRITECKLIAGSEAIDLKKCPEMKPGKFADFFDHAANLKDLDDALRSLTDSYHKHKNITGALDRARGIVAALNTLYTNYQARMDDYNKLEGELLDIQLQLKKVALQSLQVEQQHLKNILKIRARRESEEAEILRMIDDYAGFSDLYKLGFDKKVRPPCNPEDAEGAVHLTIEMSLRDLVAKLKLAEKSLDDAKSSMAAQHLIHLQPLEMEAKRLRQQVESASNDDRKREASEKLRQYEDKIGTTRRELDGSREGVRLRDLAATASAVREELSTKLLTLHLAAAISARGQIPAKLAALREAREDHAYSIRKSGVMARAYQLTVSGGVKRLALYHKGGIKPSKIAELIHAAATVAIPPVIANH